MLEYCFSEESGFNLTRKVTCGITLFGLPAVCVLGFLLNILVIGVFLIAYRRRPDQQLLPYLIALSVCDCLQIFLSAFLLVPQGLFDHGGFEQADHLWLYQLTVYFIVIFYPILMAANYASIWIKCAICVRRYLAVVYPFLQFKYRCLERNWLIIFCIVATALLANLCRFFEYSIIRTCDNCTQTDKEGLERMGVLLGRNLGTNYEYWLVVDGVLYCSLVYLLPFLLLTFLHMRIFWRILVSNEEQRSLASQSVRRREQRSNFMVLTIILVFFACQTLGLIVRFFELFGYDMDDDRLVLMRELNNLLINFNSTINPFIYCIFTRNFKDLTTEIRKKHLHSQLNSHVHGEGARQSVTYTPKSLVTEMGNGRGIALTTIRSKQSMESESPSGSKRDSDSIVLLNRNCGLSPPPSSRQSSPY